MYYKNKFINKKNAHKINSNPGSKKYSSWDIKHSERVEAYGAWIFARTIQKPLETHVHCVVPKGITPFDTILFYREIAQKLRMFCKNINIECFMIMTRQSDYLTNANEEINFLIHIPSNEYQHFSKVVKCWKYNITVSQVNYQKTVQPNGKVDSIFNRIFIAASNQSINADPTILYQKSGMITGTRVMITRKLWTKSRIKHRMNNYIACAPVIKALLPSKSTIII